MMLKRVYLAASCFLLAAGLAGNARAEKIPYANSQIKPPTPEWTAKIEGLAPARPTVAAARRKVLVFSLFTGFKHDVVPHVDRVFEILGKKSGAFDVAQTVDIEALMPDRLAACDVLVLNNNCSIGPRRNLFLDVLERNPAYRDLTANQRQAKADSLEQSILDFVADGKGLVVIHGAVTMLNNSARFTEMVGGAFYYHPPNQEVSLRTVNADCPLLAAFRGKGPFVHRDEPYCFNGPYEKLNFRPLLSLDVRGIKDPKGDVGKMVRYVAWIKPYHRGRVFYCSPSHFPESYETATLLQFLLDGVQYAAGDLKCDDSKVSLAAINTASAAASSKKPAAGRAAKKTLDPALQEIQDDPKLPRVLLIGDSISMGYTLPVRELLKGKANVHRPGTNCSSTESGLKNLDAWLGQGPWDVIHFNFGLHDLKYLDEKGRYVRPEKGKQVSPLPVYEQNLRKLVARLKKSGAKLIWCSTTPVPDGSQGRVKGDEVRYNQVAAKVMQDSGIAIDDLCAVAAAKIAEIQSPKNVHFTKDGYQQLAAAVAESIEAALGK